MGRDRTYVLQAGILYHITGFNFELIKPRTVSPEQHSSSIKRRYVITTVQNPRRSEIQQDRHNHSASICTRDPECSADCQSLARAARAHLCDSFDWGRHKGKAVDCHPAPHGTGIAHLPTSAENPRTVSCFSERFDRDSSPHVTSVRGKASPCPAAQARVPAGRISQGITAIRFLSCSLSED